MPTIFYTEDEFQALEREHERVLKRLAAVESLRPQWAEGYTSDSVAAQSKSTALSQIWRAINVDNQTDCMTQIEYYVECIGKAR